jgi:hypothetical protein
MRGTSDGLGRADGSTVLAGACYGGHVDWLWLGLQDGVEGWMFCALDGDGEGLSGCVLGLVLVRGLGRAFI